MPAPRNNPKAFADWYEADYFRRPRRPWLLLAAVLAASAVTAAAVAATFAWPGGRLAYQAGPLSESHAFLADNCAACHADAFATAARFLPARGDARATPDSACLTCHKAGNHNPHQTRFTGSDGQSASCAACHREHRGGTSIAQLPDAHCTACHADLQTTDGQHRFAAAIHHFDSDHPDFGAWRGGPLRDPGTLKFNHKVHLELAKALEGVTADRLGPMADGLARLRDLSCTACHEPDEGRRYIRPVSFDRHCAACHPITAAADEQVVKLHHPRPGESAAAVRGELLERFWKQVAARQPQRPAPAAEPDRPPLLRPSLPPLTADERGRVNDLARRAEARVFAGDGGDVLAVLEQPLFKVRGGCAYCHVETGRADGLPVYAPTRLRDRWADVTMPHERFGPAAHRTAAQLATRNRWFPYAKFSHESHRLLDCAACHAGAAASTRTADVLMPDIATCRQCHTRSTAGVRSDCLECHDYHDRSAEPRGLQGRMTVEGVLDLARPGP